MSHIRSEDIRFQDAIDEIIEIGRVTKMPVQISHIKIALKDDWETSKALITKLEDATSLKAKIGPHFFKLDPPTNNKSNDKIDAS
mgnify:CR=1 FL=1